MVIIRRSPCRVAWWVMFGDALLDVKYTKEEANEVAVDLNRKYKHVLQ